jgi:murein DD-endopeptidase MepM/ murein hydrolase activator NlpD
LAFKKITVILVPDSTKGPTQLKLPKLLLPLFVLFFLSCVVSLSWIFRDYQTMRDQMPRLGQLEKENERQKRQFIHLSQRIDEIIGNMGQMKELDLKLKVMMNLETGEGSGPGGVGGSGPSLPWPDYSEAKTHKEQVRLMHQSLDNLKTEVAMLKRDKSEFQKFLQSQKKLLASTPSIWPTKGWLSSRFGHRVSPFTEEKEFHKGIDISARMGAAIVAPADGVVFGTDFDHGFGKTVVIKHGYGVVTLYAHVKKILVKRGQYVKRGEKIALVGSTGRSTGPHLHYEVHLNGLPVNPLRYILN